MSYAVQFEVELRKLIEKEIEAALEVLSLGNVADFAEYKREVGKIQGLRLALECCEDAHTNVNKR